MDFNEGDILYTLIGSFMVIHKEKDTVTIQSLRDEDIIYNVNENDLRENVLFVDKG